MTRRFASVWLAVVLALTGCSVGAETQVQVVDDAEVPFDLLDPATPTLLPPVASRSATATLCYLDGEVLADVDVRLDASDDLVAVVGALASVPADAGPTLSTAVAAPVVRDVELAGGVATVDLASTMAELAPDQQRLVVAQLVCTLTAQPGVGSVRFTLAGTPVDVPAGDGSLTGEPLSRDDYPDQFS